MDVTLKRIMREFGGSFPASSIVAILMGRCTKINTGRDTFPTTWVMPAQPHSNVPGTLESTRTFIARDLNAVVVPLIVKVLDTSLAMDMALELQLELAYPAAASNSGRLH